MMTDIMERLRAYASDDHERGCQGRCYDCSCGYDGKRDPLIDEAAARIEQLEAALRKIDGCSGQAHVRHIARAALGEKA